MEPAFHGVTSCVPNGLVQSDLPKVSAVGGDGLDLLRVCELVRFLRLASTASELLEELEGEGPPGALVPVDGAAEEDEVGPQEGPNDWERNGCRLVNHQ